MSEIFLVRHAQASFGREKYDRLSALGIRQAQILGDYFFHLGLKFDAIYSGSMERQINTAQTVMSRFSGQGAKWREGVLGEFNEFDSSSIIMMHVEDLVREDPSISKALSNVYTDRRSFQYVSAVEALRAFTRRVNAGIAKVMEDTGRKDRVAIFTSGGTISAAMQIALGLSTEKAIGLAWQIGNTSVTTFCYNEKGLSLVSFNSVAHLEHRGEPELITYL
jgi:broad specificity phosphatase PhoE